MNPRLLLPALLALGLVACDEIVVVEDPVVVTNRKPQFATTPPPQTVTEGTQLTITLAATDPEGDGITYELRTRPDSSMQIDAGTGTITWTPDYDVASGCRGTEGFTIVVVAKDDNEAGALESDPLSIDINVKNDLDEDGTADDVDTDIDGDGVSNTDEVTNGADGTDECKADSDSDGVEDGADNCPSTANPVSDCDGNAGTPMEQCDDDDDGLGNVCDVGCPKDPLNDPDGDGVCNSSDNCPDVKNPPTCASPGGQIQCDDDDDGIGDACDDCPGDPINDPDNDQLCAFASDGVTVIDNCPQIFNDGQEDSDNDDVGDLCDACKDDPTNDEDDDGVCEDVDNCPGVKNVDQADLDSDDIGDACDPDIDGDDVPNTADDCPMVADPDQIDTDGDGAGDACDEDDDDDGVNDLEADGVTPLDNCPLVKNAEQVDLDGDGVGFQCDTLETLPAALHASGAAAARVSGHAQAGTIALTLESRESPCTAATCPTPGVLVVDADDHAYVKRFATADPDSAWLDIPAGSGSELGEPHVGQGGRACFGAEKTGTFDLRCVNNATGVAEKVFKTQTVASATGFVDAPNGRTLAEVKIGSGNFGVYDLATTSGAGGDPALVCPSCTASGIATTTPPLGPFEMPCMWVGCMTQVVPAAAVVISDFIGLDDTLYLPFVAQDGTISVKALTATGSALMANVTFTGSSDGPFTAKQARFIKEDPDDGTPWYCLRRDGASSNTAEFFNVVNGAVPAASRYKSFFAASCEAIEAYQNPVSGYWFFVGPAVTGVGKRVMVWQPGTTPAKYADLYPAGSAPTAVQVLFAGGETYIARMSSDGDSIEPQMVTKVDRFVPATSGSSLGVAEPLAGDPLYAAIVVTNGGGWVGVVGRDARTFTANAHIIARRFKPGVTSAAEQTTLRNEPSDTANPTPYRAWVGPDGAVWGWYSTSESIGPRRLSVYPATGPTVPLSPGNGPGLDQGNLDDGAKVTFHPAGTLVSVRTNASVGTLKWAKTTAAGTTLEPFSPAVQTEGGLHVDVLAGVVPPGQPTDLVAYPTSAGITLARFLPGTGGAAPTLATVATGLTGLPKAWLGANLEPWVFFETASGWTIGHVATGGVFEEYVADVENATEVRQTIDGRPTLWGTLFRRTATGAMCVCRFPTLPPLADDVGCWTASEDDASIAWGPFVSEDGAAYLVSTTVVDSGPNLDVTLFRNRNVAPEFDGPSGCP